MLHGMMLCYQKYDDAHNYNHIIKNAEDVCYCHSPSSNL